MNDKIFNQVYDYVTHGHFGAHQMAIPGTLASADIVSNGILKAVELEPGFAKDLEKIYSRFMHDDLGEWKYLEDKKLNEQRKAEGMKYEGSYIVDGLKQDFVLVEYNPATFLTTMCFDFER